MNKKIAAILFCILNITALYAAPPRLVVQIVVDQLRGDLLQKYQNKFGAQGFNYLINYGVFYKNAHHPHAHTVTCVGHSTVATGSYPSLHGIVANHWYDRKTGKQVYCMEDLSAKILPTALTRKQPAGRSPRHLLASTISDEIVLAQKGRAFGVSIKDRSAITLAGHAGQAFWFDLDNGGFITSNYYYTQYPQWVVDWNAKYKAKEETWQLSKPANSYQFIKSPVVKPIFPNFGQNFPHTTGKPGSTDYYQLLCLTPIADEITADFAIQLIDKEQLGKAANQTDYLGISFSAVDKIGHIFGPNSIESEDNLLRLDNTLTRLFTAIDQQVGLQNTLIILTADHGVSDSLTYLKMNRIRKHLTLNEQKFRQVIIDRLQQQFNLPPETLQSIDFPFVYLNHDIIEHNRLLVSQVSLALVETLRMQPGIFQAYTLPVMGTEKDWLSKKVNKMAYLKRSGDIYLVAPPYQEHSEQIQQRVDHGTPWQYDSFVPLLFAGPSFKEHAVYRPVRTTDIAATVAAILGIKAPTASVGIPLSEVIENYK